MRNLQKRRKFNLGNEQPRMISKVFWLIRISTFSVTVKLSQDHKVRWPCFSKKLQWSMHINSSQFKANKLSIMVTDNLYMINTMYIFICIWKRTSMVFWKQLFLISHPREHHLRRSTVFCAKWRVWTMRNVKHALWNCALSQNQILHSYEQSNVQTSI